MFASEAISAELAQRFVEDQRFNAQHFASTVRDIPEFASWRGYLLEACAHKQLPKGGRKKLKMLSNGIKGLTEWDVPVMNVDPPFTEISLLNQVMPGHYLRPRRKNYPTVDSLVVLDKSIFHPGGLALVLLQFTGSQTHEADGSVAKRVHDEVGC